MRKNNLLILVLLGLSIPECIAQDLSGTWYWENGNEDHSEITFESDTNSLTPNSYIGGYCSVFFNGSKVDCVFDESEVCISISPTSKVNEFQGTFTSPSFDGTGSFNLIYNPVDNNFVFTILNSTGEFYLPRNKTFEK